MPQPGSPSGTGWRGICLVAITYVYFLIFAQFAFLKRLAQLNIADTHLKAVMAAMAFGGILFSLLTPRLKLLPSPRHRLQIAFALCAAAAASTLLPLQLPASIAVSFLIGSGLGLLTVTLVTHLRSWLGQTNPLLKIGLGTGLGYLLCNFPPLFTASAQTQALTAASLCLAGIFIASTPPLDDLPQPATTQPVSFPRVLLSFTALVWLDSAAFYIIQNTPTLKAGTWEGTLHLWLNGALHLAAALASAWLLRRRGLSFVLSAALVALACACLLLLDPARALIASAFYPIGVSLYSVTLVAYPSLLASSTEDRARHAGWIYAIAGWCGSAMGIGMGQNLGHVPPAFVAMAAAIVLAVPLIDLFLTRRRELALTATVLAAAFCLNRLINSPHPALTSIDRGRQVYIAEGCINCHSQYVRPNSPDVQIWGPIQTLDELRREHPPLIGNRRQGPDLAEVGTRRSPLWLKAHFYNPAELSHTSFMPTYARLFSNSTRGDDLIAYLTNLQGAGTASHQASQQTWQPSSTSASATDGANLFANFCATCHAPSGRTRQTWQQSFHRQPPLLTTGPFLHLPPSDTPTQRRNRLARIIKFGLPNTDMPGHEYLPDNDIASLTLWLQQTIPQTPQPSPLPGENR